jgi:hypothetical protein
VRPDDSVIAVMILCRNAFTCSWYLKLSIPAKYIVRLALRAVALSACGASEPVRAGLMMSPIPGENGTATDLDWPPIAGNLKVARAAMHWLIPVLYAGRRVFGGCSIAAATCVG